MSSSQEFADLLRSVSERFSAGNEKLPPIFSAVDDFSAFVVGEEHSLREIAEKYGYSSDTEEDYRFNLRFQDEGAMRRGWLKAHIAVGTIYSRKTWAQFVKWLNENHLDERGRERYDIDLVKLNESLAA